MPLVNSSKNADPVASKSTVLCQYMNTSHSETLLSYVVSQVGEEARTARECKMTSINSRGLTITYHLPSGKKGKQTALIPFDPPIETYEEVRPRLLQMKTDSEEKSGLNRRPTIDRFAVTPQHLITFVLIGLQILCTLDPGTTWVPVPYLRAASHLRNFVGGWRTVYATWIFLGLAHTGEAGYQWHLARYYGASTSLALKWTVATAIVGFPSLMEFRRIIKRKQIESIRTGKAS